MAIFHTSGTTGVSKGVVLPHNHHFDFGCCTRCSARAPGRTTPGTSARRITTLAQFMSTIPALLAGGGIALAERFSASRFWETSGAIATVAWMVYTTAPIFLKQPERPDDADNPLRVHYTVGIASSLVGPLEKRFGVKVLQMMGSTESSTSCCPWLGERIPRRARSARSRP